MDMFGSASRRGQLLLVGLSFAVACGCSSSGDGPSSDQQLLPDAGASDDAAVPDLQPDVRQDSEPDVTTTAPTDYCEAVVDGYCDFYIRCGRMAVETVQRCREVFLETCNERYEPVYVALAEAKLLSLSDDGLKACMAHLATVACEQQIRDLDGACSQVWVGQQPVGKPCGVGIESFVCAPGSDCRLSLDLCGVCTAVADIGEPCGADLVCGPVADCIQGSCHESRSPGQACDSSNRCVLGASCVEGFCLPPSFGAAGAECDSAHRCQYRTACVGGSCRQTAMLGEPCDAATPCDSGRCASSTSGGSVCEARLAFGQPCDAHADCLSGRCLAGACDAVVGRCF